MKILVEALPDNKKYFSFEGENRIESNLIKTLDILNYVENLTRIINEEYKTSETYRKMVNQHLANRKGKTIKEIKASIISDIAEPFTDIFLKKAPSFMNTVKKMMKPFLKTQWDLVKCAAIQSAITNVVVVLALEELTGKSFYIREFVEEKG